MPRKPKDCISIEIPNEDKGFASAFAQGAWEHASKDARQAVSTKIMHGVLCAANIEDLVATVVQDAVKEHLQDQIRSEMGDQIKDGVKKALGDKKKVETKVHKGMESVLPEMIREKAQGYEERVSAVVEALYTADGLIEIVKPVVQQITEPLIKEMFVTELKEIFELNAESIRRNTGNQIRHLIDVFEQADTTMTQEAETDR